MRAIQTFLPTPRHTEIHRIFVNAQPEVTWQMARNFDMSDIGWIKMLFDIRTFPEAFCGKNGEGTKRGLGIDEITKADTGFMILYENPGKEVVIGSIGKFWHLKIPFQQVTIEEYKVFDEPGFGKLHGQLLLNRFSAALYLSN